MKKFFYVLMTLAVLVTGCSKHEDSDTVSVGTIAGPETTLMSVAKKVALEKYGLHVKIVQFTDYNMPNQALSEGEIDVNAFQHVPYLQDQIKARGYDFVPVGNTFLYPMGLYSSKVASLKALQNNAKVAIPNDPSNEARALLLLQKAKLITLKSSNNYNADLQDITSNPKHLQFLELDAAEMPRTLSDVSIAAINSNYAIPAKLSPSKSLFLESTDSPYMNVFVARKKNADEKKITELVKAYQSQAVLDKAKAIFGDAAIAGFKP